MVTVRGERIGLGDRVATRRNDPDLGVANRQTWTVTGIGDDYSLILRGRGRDCLVPAEYAIKFVDLAYATTVHGAQGETVDRTHVAIGDTTGAAAAYVAMTRGRNGNTAHLVAESVHDAERQWVEVFGRHRADLGPAHAKRQAVDAVDRYGSQKRRQPTVRQAETHIKRIKAAFGTMPLGSVRPSHVRTWCAQMSAEGLEDSYVYALHARLAQVYADAVHDGLVAKSPCSRRTSPAAGKQRPYVCTTEQMWALHDALPERLRAAMLLGAFAGLHDAEVCGLRVSDIDFMRGVIKPWVQYPADDLKTKTSKTALPIPQSLALALSAHVAKWSADGFVLVNEWGDQLAPWTLQHAIRLARERVPGLPPDFRFHDLRHYLASMLIASGADVKVVQARLRHASAKTTLDTYAHLWPDADESTRTAIDAVMQLRAQSLSGSSVNAST